MPTKSANNALELSYINFDSTNNRIDFALPISSNASTIGGEDEWARIQANAAFASANNVDLTPAFNQANSSFVQANAAFVRANVSAQYGANTTSNSFFALPSGTTAERPSQVAAGHIRFNTTTGEPEWYSAAGNQWLGFSKGPNYTVEYLVIAGGGGGGYDAGGGGGAGGLFSATFTASSQTSYLISIGGGGTGSSGSQAGTGSNTTIAGIVTAVGGGFGGDGIAGSGSFTGGNGGSGGGGAGDPAGQNVLGGSGIAGQGFAGGLGFHSSGFNAGGGGGGGAGGVGENMPGTVPTGNPQRAGNGGPGSTTFSAWALATSTGSSQTYAGGGGGGINNDGGNTGAAGVGGSGGGGPGSRTGAGTAGTTNTGGGGGGGCRVGGAGAAGGSGIAILRYVGSQRGTGGNLIITTGGYTYHVFTGLGTFIA